MPVSWQNLLEEAAAGGGSYEPLPNGEYVVNIVEASHTTTQAGKLMFKTKMKVEGGPHDGRFVWNQFVVSPENANALSIFFSQMKTLGLDTEFFATQPSEDAIVSALQGKRCIVVLDQREWQGQMRNNVKSLKPATGVAPAPTGVTPAPTAPAVPVQGAAAAPASPAKPF
jgi:Protein of unknown function (DUF669)